MTATDYLINAGFILMVCWQAREKRLDRRALVIPLVILFFVARQYLHTIPVSGNDLVLIGLLAGAGVSLGLLSGFATHVRRGNDGFALARVGWVAGALLDRRHLFEDRLRVRRHPRRRAGDPQLQHRPPDQRSGLAGGPGLHGDLRSHGSRGDRVPPRPRHPGSPRSDHQRLRCCSLIDRAGVGTPPDPSYGPGAFYCLQRMLAPGELTSMTDLSTASDGESRRVLEARERAEQRVQRQRDTLRPLGLAVILVVVASAIAERPSPAFQGRGLGVTLALVAFAGALAQAIRPGFTARQRWFQAAVISLMGAAGAALVALQPQGATDLAGGAAVWMALVRLPLKSGVAIGVAVAIASVSAAALAGSAPAALLAAGLLLAMLGFVGYFMRQSRANQDRVELLLAQLEDARDEQTQAAAIAERSRIAGELHDVLAHSLSAAAIQLQAARKLAEHDRATPSTRAAIDRAGDLVKDGLVNARQAVGALRGEELPGVAQIRLADHELQERPERRRSADR